MCYILVKNLAEDPDPVSMLHMLYTMTFTPLGHSAVVQVLTYENNISVLVPFVTLSGRCTLPTKQKI